MKKNKLLVSILIVTLIGVLLIAAAKHMLLSPQKMILGVWVQDTEQTYSFYQGQKYRTQVLDYTYNFVTPTLLSTGESYYITDKELGFQFFGQPDFDVYQIVSLRPDRLVLKLKWAEDDYMQFVYVRP